MHISLKYRKLMTKNVSNSHTIHLKGSSSNKNKSIFSRLDQDSLQQSSLNSLAANKGTMNNINNLNNLDLSNNISGDMRIFDTSKDISINDCMKFTDQNLSSIDNSIHINSKPINMFKSVQDNKENMKYFNHLSHKLGENSYVYDSNQSMEMCSSANIQQPVNFNANSIQNSNIRLNNTGKFALQNFSKSGNSIENSEEPVQKLNPALSEEAKNALLNLNKTINNIFELTSSRWEDLKVRFSNT